ncbi:uncharacterized protein LOC108606048 [Drosophila busckii]|uniref:uncharacterized protein LOC108606048 n=1 Tax=Drosophila busckii TaxID=30019 RepID=UPI00083F3A97|nr:uncharacterized protein LOC108606048 [Drosophila busckii]
MSELSHSHSHSDNDSRLSGKSSSSSSSGSVSVSSPRIRSLARLDRLLRRWLPGYNYLRGASSNHSSRSSRSGRSSSSNNCNAIGNGVTRASEQPRPVSRPSVQCEQQVVESPALQVRPRRAGEVYLDTGIAKTEFCLQLEKLLRAKLLVKDLRLVKSPPQPNKLRAEE